VNTIQQDKQFMDYAYGISGNSIVGWYVDSSGVGHGFLYTTPEPVTLFLLGLGTGDVDSRYRKHNGLGRF
jgi:hypothetical protein